MRASRIGLVVAWGLAAALLAANVAGYALDLYRSFWWFDRVLHGGTLFAMTFWLAVIAFAPCLSSIYPTAGRRVMTILLLAAAGVACGALWEVIEWLYDKVEPGNVIKGKDDTILDLVMDTIGALLAAALADSTFDRGTHAGSEGAAPIFK